MAERQRANATPDVSDDDEMLWWMGLRSIASSVLRRWQNLGIFLHGLDSSLFFAAHIYKHFFTKLDHTRFTCVACSVSMLISMTLRPLSMGSVMSRCFFVHTFSF